MRLIHQSILLLLLLFVLSAIMLVNPQAARADSCAESYFGSMDLDMQSANVKADGGCQPDEGPSSQRPNGPSSSPSNEPNQVEPSETTPVAANAPDPNRTITITQLYCMDIEGVAMMDCLQAERAACREPDSRWVIRAQYPANDPDALE
jgi:hypothetical protein